MRVRSPSPASFARKLAIAVYILAGESLVNRKGGNFSLKDGVSLPLHSIKCETLKLVGTETLSKTLSDWDYRPKLYSITNAR